MVEADGRTHKDHRTDLERNTKTALTVCQALFTGSASVLSNVNQEEHQQYSLCYSNCFSRLLLHSMLIIVFQNTWSMLSPESVREEGRREPLCWDTTNPLLECTVNLWGFAFVIPDSSVPGNSLSEMVSNYCFTTIVVPQFMNLIYLQAIWFSTRSVWQNFSLFCKPWVRWQTQTWPPFLQKHRRAYLFQNHRTN